MAKLDKLITFAFMKEECDLPQNLPDAELEGKIYQAQEMLRMIMCEEFYLDLVAQYKANTMSAAYLALYNPYVKQFVAWRAHENWIIKANFKVNRSGIRVHTEENSVVATDIQMATLIKDAKYKTQYYKNLLTSFLDQNSADYPLYCACKDPKVNGNSFHISAVKNKHKAPQPYGTHGGCCGC